jgi:hypothetical protein
MTDQAESSPFTLLEVNNSIRTFEPMLCTVHSAHASRRVTLGKLRVGLVHSVEGRPACIDLERREEKIRTTRLKGYTPLR